MIFRDSPTIFDFKDWPYWRMNIQELGFLDCESRNHPLDISHWS